MALFALNFFLFLALGVSSLFWVSYHTEAIDVVGGLLGLGGVFAWIAFVMGLITDERKNAVRVSLDSFLSKGAATFVCLAAVCILLVVGSCFGSIRIDTRRDAAGRMIEIRRASDDSWVSEDRIQGNSLETFPVAVYWRTRRYEIRLDGLPSVRVEVEPFHRRDVEVPRDLLLDRRVLLIRPTTEVSQTVRKQDVTYQLVLYINEREVGSLDNYRGQSVWVGCESTVAIPAALRQQWRLQLGASGLAEALMIPWLQTEALMQDSRLDSGSRVRVVVQAKNTEPWAGKEVAVEDCRSVSCFPQEIVIDAHTR